MKASYEVEEKVTNSRTLLHFRYKAPTKYEPARHILYTHHLAAISLQFI